MYNNLVASRLLVEESDIENLLIIHNKFPFRFNFLCQCLIQVYSHNIIRYFLATFEKPDVEEKYFSFASWTRFFCISGSLSVRPCAGVMAYTEVARPEVDVFICFSFLALTGFVAND